MDFSFSDLSQTSRITRVYCEEILRGAEGFDFYCEEEVVLCELKRGDCVLIKSSTKVNSLLILTPTLRKPTPGFADRR